MYRERYDVSRGPVVCDRTRIRPILYPAGDGATWRRIAPNMLDTRSRTSVITSSIERNVLAYQRVSSHSGSRSDIMDIIGRYTAEAPGDGRARRGRSVPPSARAAGSSRASARPSRGGAGGPIRTSADEGARGYGRAWPAGGLVAGLRGRARGRGPGGGRGVQKSAGGRGNTWSPRFRARCARALVVCR